MRDDVQQAVQGMTEIGQTGLRQAGGFIIEEFLPALRGKLGVKTLREMGDNDPIVGGIVIAFQQVAGNLDWHIEQPENATLTDVAATRFIREAWEDMDTSWDSVLSQVMSMVVYGWSLFEVNYKLRQGSYGQWPSRMTDGLIGWRSWSIRSQNSLYRWQLGDHGEVLAMVQQDPTTGRQYTIPLEKALLFRTTEERNNPEGRSMLRNAYVPWFYKTRLQEIEAIGVERDLAGLPKVTVPAQWLDGGATDADRQSLAAAQKLASDVRQNRQEGIVVPALYDQAGNKMFDFELVSTGGSKQMDTDKIITRYKSEIAQSVLADFLTLGHEGTGSFALAKTKMSLWVSAVEALCRSIADVVNRHAIKKLLDLNSIPYVNPPELVYGTVQDVDLGALGQFITALSGAGLLSPDEPLENALRAMAGLPVDDSQGT